MSTQQKSSGGGRKSKTSGAGQKDGVAMGEQNNNQTQNNSKKHNNVNAKDAVNNNSSDQPKTEKEKPHVKVSGKRVDGSTVRKSRVHWREAAISCRRRSLFTVNESNYIFSSPRLFFLSARINNQHSQQPNRFVSRRLQKSKAASRIQRAKRCHSWWRWQSAPRRTPATLCTNVITT